MIENAYNTTRPVRSIHWENALVINIKVRFLNPQYVLHLFSLWTHPLLEPSHLSTERWSESSLLESLERSLLSQAVAGKVLVRPRPDACKGGRVT